MDEITEVQPHDDVLLVVVIPSRLDETSARDLVDEVLVAAASKPSVPVVLDLSRVKFAPSVALGSLVQLSKGFKLDNRRMAIIGINRRLMDAIRVTRLHVVLEIHDTLEKMLKASA